MGLYGPIWQQSTFQSPEKDEIEEVLLTVNGASLRKPLVPPDYQVIKSLILATPVRILHFLLAYPWRGKHPQTCLHPHGEWGIVLAGTDPQTWLRCLSELLQEQPQPLPAKRLRKVSTP